jgi:diamine N-acetyltransferase
MSVEPGRVSLREVTGETVIAVTRLAVDKSQEGFVSPNAISFAQALFAPEAWYRAIYLDDTPVGFVMLEDQTLSVPPPAEPQISLWRYMIDASHQRQGIGRVALGLVIDEVRRRKRFTRLETSYVPGPGCPEPFYLGLGFRHTGRLDGREVVLELPLDEPAP